MDKIVEEMKKTKTALGALLPLDKTDKELLIAYMGYNKTKANNFENKEDFIKVNKKEKSLEVKVSLGLDETYRGNIILLAELYARDILQRTFNDITKKASEDGKYIIITFKV